MSKNDINALSELKDAIDKIAKNGIKVKQTSVPICGIHEDFSFPVHLDIPNTLHIEIEGMADVASALYNISEVIDNLGSIAASIDTYTRTIEGSDE